MLEMLEPLKFVKYLVHPKYLLALIDFTQKKNQAFQMRPTGEFIKKPLIRI